MHRENCRYQPFYCEENVWHLVHDPAFDSRMAAALFISNRESLCPIWFQRAAPAPREPVIWDYHVVALTREPEPLVWDLDSTLTFPTPAADWLAASFAGAKGLHRAYWPSFKLLDRSALDAYFASDRRHMLTEAGDFSEPPPPWSPIGCPVGPHTLDRILDFNAGYGAPVLSLRALLALTAPAAG